LRAGQIQPGPGTGIRRRPTRRPGRPAGACDPATVRASDRSVSFICPAYELISSTEIVSAMALERMLAGLSARQYSARLEPVGAGIEARAGSKSYGPDRGHDRDLSGAFQERQAPAGRPDGGPLVRRRDAQNRSPIPRRQRQTCACPNFKPRSRLTSPRMSVQAATMKQ
jgi:hypothetical protein